MRFSTIGTKGTSTAKVWFSENPVTLRQKLGILSIRHLNSGCNKLLYKVAKFDYDISLT